MSELDTGQDASGAIDPKRPWITDPRDAPSAMNWVETLTNPAGTTSRVHFTRAWTGLFFLRVIYFFGTATLAAVFAAAGGSFSLPNWIWPVLVIVTALLSLVLHIRRLSDAQKSPLWAVLVLLPIILGAGAFVGGVAMGGAQYGQIVEQREARERQAETPDATDIAAADEASEDTAAEAGADAAQGSEGNGEGQQRGQRGRGGPGVDVTEISQRDHAFTSGLGLAQGVWAPVSFLVMLWSLLWVGRLPTGGGTIKSRFEGQVS